MLKFSTGRSKPGWGKTECRPVWWPNDVPWANVRSDVRTTEQKKKVRLSSKRYKIPTKLEKPNKVYVDVCIKCTCLGGGLLILKLSLMSFEKDHFPMCQEMEFCSLLFNVASEA